MVIAHITFLKLKCFLLFETKSKNVEGLINDFLLVSQSAFHLSLFISVSHYGSVLLEPFVHPPA